jgi:hypothetical protein
MGVDSFILSKDEPMGTEFQSSIYLIYIYIYRFSGGWIILLATCLLAGLLNLFLQPWRLRQYVPPKRRLKLNGLYGVISQKIIFFELICLGSYMVQQLVLITFKLQMFPQFNCHTACLVDLLDCKWKLLEPQSPEHQWLVISLGLFLYKCSQFDQTIYTIRKPTFLLVVPFQTLCENSIALLLKT